MALDLPEEVKKLHQVRMALKATFGNLDLNFTPDGKIIGDIGKALASHYFGVELNRRVPFHGIVSGINVVIRATGKGSPSLQFGIQDKNIEGFDRAKLLVFELDFENAKANVSYNGPILEAYKNKESNFRLDVYQLEKINLSFQDIERIQLI